MEFIFTVALIGLGIIGMICFTVYKIVEMIVQAGCIS